MLKIWLCLKAIVMWPYPKNSSQAQIYSIIKRKKQQKLATNGELADQAE